MAKSYGKGSSNLSNDFLILDRYYVINRERVDPTIIFASHDNDGFDFDLSILYDRLSSGIEDIMKNGCNVCGKKIIFEYLIDNQPHKNRGEVNVKKSRHIDTIKTVQIGLGDVFVRCFLEDINGGEVCSVVAEDSESYHTCLSTLGSDTFYMCESDHDMYGENVKQCTCRPNIFDNKYV